MKVNFAHICDYAIIAQDGKLSVLGIFENVHVLGLPAVHPKMLIAFQIEPSHAEVGNSFDIAIHCVDQDGHKLFEMIGKMKTALAPGATSKPADHPRFNQVVEIGGLQIKKMGTHDVNILINGELRHTVSFNVQPVPASPAPPARA